jgi:hypothetical protein
MRPFALSPDDERVLDHATALLENGAYDEAYTLLTGVDP